MTPNRRRPSILSDRPVNRTTRPVEREQRPVSTEAAAVRRTKRTGALTREDMANSVKLKTTTSFDYTILFLVLFFFVFGLVMICSISAYNATKYYDDSLKFVKGQMLYGAIGIVLMILIGSKGPWSKLLDYHIVQSKIRIKRLHYSFSWLMVFLYFACLIMQAIVLFKGHSMNGSSRWLNLGPIRLQPSEITKLYAIIYAAYTAQASPKKLDNPFRFLIVIAPMAPLLYLVAKENLSTGIIIGGICLVVYWVTSRKNWYFVAALIAAAIGIGLSISGTGYRSKRIDKWLNVETSKDAYQILQGLYALAAGGWFGKGLGNSVQKLGYIPEVHTDMIFSCIVEELGLFGAFFLIALYGVLLFRILLVAMHAKDLLGSLICVGVFVQLAAQIIINIAVVTNSMPATGVPLPFVSYGGSSLIFTMIEIALVLNVSRQIEYTE